MLQFTRRSLRGKWKLINFVGGVSHTYVLWPWSTPLAGMCFWRFLKILKVCSRPKFAQDSKSGLRSGRGCSEVYFFWRWTCKYFHINSDKIRTSPQPGPRNAWIGNPHQQNCMVEVGTGSLHTKVHPEKKPQSKKTRRCWIGNLIHYSTPSSFSTSGFFL